MYVCSHEHFMISDNQQHASFRGRGSKCSKEVPHMHFSTHLPICMYPYACTHMHVPICIIPGEGMHASFRGRESKCSKEQVQ